MLSVQASLTGTLTFLVVPCNEFPVAENEVDDSSVSVPSIGVPVFSFFDHGNVHVGVNLFYHGNVGYQVGVNRPGHLGYQVGVKLFSILAM